VSETPAAAEEAVARAAPQPLGGGDVAPSPAAAESDCNCGRSDCPTCGPRVTAEGLAPRAASAGDLYAIGRIEARFPNLAVEKELAQATARAETTGLSDREAIQRILSQPENAYLARQLCWILTIEGIEAYILVPRDSTDVETLVSSLRPTPRLTDIDVVVGTIGPVAPSSACNGLQLPTVVWAQIYSFDVDSFIASLAPPEDVDDQQWAATVEDVLDRILQLADNTGASDEDRAVNYLATRYPAIYQTVAEMYGRNRSLSAVSVRRSQLSAARRLVDVVFSFRDRQTDVEEKLFARVDITEVFPFLVTKLSPYYDR
jgi:hypothetical protein